MELKTIRKFANQIKGVSWEPTSTKIVVAIDEADLIKLEIFGADGAVFVSGSIDKMGRLRNVMLNDQAQLILVVFDHDAVLVDALRMSIVEEIHREDGFLGGEFGENTLVHLTIPGDSDSASVDWSIWNFSTGDFREYELERNCHYGRGAILHPSKSLIGTCWNAHGCGFYIHTTNPEGFHLPYFDFGKHRCFRSEYESYAPSFNQTGDKFAFVADPFLCDEENIEVLCVYSIESQNVL